MSTVAERIAALNAKKTEASAQPVQRSGVKWQKPAQVEVKTSEGASPGPRIVSPQAAVPKTTPSWIKNGSTSTAPLNQGLKPVASKTSPIPSPQSSPPPNGVLGSSAIPVLESVSKPSTAISKQIDTKPIEKPEEAIPPIIPVKLKEEPPKDIPQVPLSVNGEANPKVSATVPVAELEKTPRAPESLQAPEKILTEPPVIVISSKAVEEPAPSTSTESVIESPPLPPSRKSSLVYPSTSMSDAITLLHVANTPSAPGEPDAANSAPPVIPASRRSSSVSESGVDTAPPEPEKPPPAAESEKPLVTAGSRRTIRFAEAPVVVEYNERKIELGIEHADADVPAPPIAAFEPQLDLPPPPPPLDDEVEDDLDDDDDSLIRDEDDDEDEEAMMEDEDNEVYEMRDEEEKKESKTDSGNVNTKSPVGLSRPSLIRDVSGGGSRRSVKFGNGDEIKVEEFSYEDLERAADEPPSPVYPPSINSAGEDTSVQPRRRSSLSERMVSVIKRATGSKKDEQESPSSKGRFRNGLSWG